jgi:2-dehydro-3-deoxyphosphogalactonate aldolase
MMRFEDAFRDMPIIAILRGVRPQEVVAIARKLFAAGIRIVEVPLNSPEPLKSISLLAEAFADRLVVGAGTVLDPEAVDTIRGAGGKIIVAPNTEPSVIQKALECEMEPIPGFATATEAFTASRAGARYLKLFPAVNFGPSYVKALNAVLPEPINVIAVGGVTAPQFAEWSQAGAKGFGLGSELYRPGQSPEETARVAAVVVAAVNALSRRS